MRRNFQQLSTVTFKSFSYFGEMIEYKVTSKGMCKPFTMAKAILTPEYTKEKEPNIVKETTTKILKFELTD